MSEGRLLDVAGVQAYLGISRAAAERIFRKLPKVHDPDIRKTWIRRADLEAWEAAHTHEDELVKARPDVA